MKILICIFGIILIVGGGFFGLISPFLTDSGRPEMIRAFYVVLACTIATDLSLKPTRLRHRRKCLHFIDRCDRYAGINLVPND